MEQVLAQLCKQLSCLEAKIDVLSQGVLSVEQAAKYLSISPRNLESLFREGKVKRVQLSAKRFGYLRTELDRYAQENSKAYLEDWYSN